MKRRCKRNEEIFANMVRRTHIKYRKRYDGFCTVCLCISDAVGILKIVAAQFFELTVKVLDVFAERGMVATRILYDGVHTGTCMGIPATGKHITFEALENFKVENGKITESWGYWPDKEIEQKLKSA